MSLSHVVAALLLSFLLGGVFLASALPKLRSPKAFLLAVVDYRILPLSLARPYAWLVLRGELLCALLLLSGLDVPLAAGLATLLLLSFIVAVAINIMRGRELECHCFGAARRRRGGWRVLHEDIVLLGGAIALFALAVESPGPLAPWSPLRVAVGTPLAAVPTSWVRTWQWFAAATSIGIYLVATWGLAELLQRSRNGARPTPRIEEETRTHVRHASASVVSHARMGWPELESERGKGGMR